MAYSLLAEDGGGQRIRMKRRPSMHDLKSLPDLNDTDDLVDCFLTGKKIPRAEAKLVRLGPGTKVWLPKECCRPG